MVLRDDTPIRWKINFHPTPGGCSPRKHIRARACTHTRTRTHTHMQETQLRWCFLFDGHTYTTCSWTNRHVLLHYRWQLTTSRERTSHYHSKRCYDARKHTENRAPDTLPLYNIFTLPAYDSNAARFVRFFAHPGTRVPTGNGDVSWRQLLLKLCVVYGTALY